MQQLTLEAAGGAAKDLLEVIHQIEVAQTTEVETQLCKTQVTWVVRFFSQLETILTLSGPRHRHQSLLVEIHMLMLVHSSTNKT